MKGKKKRGNSPRERKAKKDVENEREGIRTNRITAGLLAHVDAGKTTLSENMLFLGGKLRRAGRVDHGDAFLDADALEKERGITIFASQASFPWNGREITLVDTPGHVDFSAETERTLQVLDCAVLLISAPDGVQGHTRTLWRLLEQHHVPVFIFVNKMDLPGTDREKILRSLKKELSPDCHCPEFSQEKPKDAEAVRIIELPKDACTSQKNGSPKGSDAARLRENAKDAYAVRKTGSPKVTGAVQKNESRKGTDSACTAENSGNSGWISAESAEEFALFDDAIAEEYLESGQISLASLRAAVKERRAFPCFFGSALHGEGVSELLDALCMLMPQAEYPPEFGAKVFKITRDADGTRLTHMKITGGVLRAKDKIDGIPGKVNQLRLYSGEKFVAVPFAEAGQVCAAAGLENTSPGQGLGAQADGAPPVLVPVLTYRVILPDSCGPYRALEDFRRLEEENPELHILWQEETRNIQVQLMGEVQLEILQEQVKSRFGYLVEFGEGNIVYKETIASAAEGVGHFEPLRHYAEVQLLLEPGERGSGVQIACTCRDDVLDKNFQRLICTHLAEKEHVGVLIGAPVTDIRITVTGGRANKKHTQGGDFRQASYRAVRQGLRKAECLLLEPYYAFRMSLPAAYAGRAMTDIANMSGKPDAPMTDGEVTVLTGSAPAACMNGYQKEFLAYTGGKGQLTLTVKGYDVCHNPEEVLEKSSYRPDEDAANPCGSVFCAHGAGFSVDWDEVELYMHMESRFADEGADAQMEMTLPKRRYSAITLTQEELDAIYVRTPDPRKDSSARTVAGKNSGFRKKRRDEEQVAYTGKSGEGTADYPEKGAEGSAAYPGRGAGESGAYPDSKERNKAAGLPRAGNKGYRLREAGQHETREEYLLVDGYNIIFAWDELRELAKLDVKAARDTLADILCDYQGYKGTTVILVFDAYRVENNPGRTYTYHNIYVVFTKEAETADQYIEKTVRQKAPKHTVTVATSDALEQVIVLGGGAKRLSAREFREEVRSVREEVRQKQLEMKGRMGNYLFDSLDTELARRLELVRLGKGTAESETSERKTKKRIKT